MKNKHSTNKTDRHDITEIFLKVALNSIEQTNKQTNKQTNHATTITTAHKFPFIHRHLPNIVIDFKRIVNRRILTEGSNVIFHQK
jgi:hypothetical protein